jgi:hypothetical protein
MALALLAVVGVLALAVASTMATLVQLVATTALIMGGTGMKALGDPHHWGPGTYVDQVNNTYLHLSSSDLKWVETPENFWPVTGLTDLTFDASVARGELSLDNAVHTTTGPKVVFGYSQSATIATREKRHLDQQRAAGATDVPPPADLSFVLVANPNRPNGGILERFPGLHIPILNVSFDGATPNDDYPTIDVARQYDPISDFPKYPINLLADANALFGYMYLHRNYGSGTVNLSDPTTYQSYTSGKTTYYLVHTEHLPLLQPLRDLGFPKPILDLVEPVLRVLIETAYDRTPEHMATPTPAQLIPRIDGKKLIADLGEALRQGVHDALDDLGIKTPAPKQKIPLDTAPTGAETITPAGSPKTKTTGSQPQIQSAPKDSEHDGAQPKTLTVQGADDKTPTTHDDTAKTPAPDKGRSPGRIHVRTTQDLSGALKSPRKSSAPWGKQKAADKTGSNNTPATDTGSSDTPSASNDTSAQPKSTDKTKKGQDTQRKTQPRRQPALARQG